MAVIACLFALLLFRFVSNALDNVLDYVDALVNLVSSTDSLGNYMDGMNDLC